MSKWVAQSIQSPPKQKCLEITKIELKCIEVSRKKCTKRPKQ